MPGRFAQYTEALKEKISTTHPQLDPRTQEAGDVRPSYNVVHRGVVQVLRRIHDPEDGFVNVLQPMNWGIIPRSERDDRTIYALAQAEAIIGGSSPLWNEIMTHPEQRCVIPINGYYAWTTNKPPKPPKPVTIKQAEEQAKQRALEPKRKSLEAKKKTVPYYMKHKDDKLLFVAGFWEQAQLEGDDHLTYTFTIINTPNTRKLEFLDGRMPIILKDEPAIRQWLHSAALPSDSYQRLLRANDLDLIFYPVPPDVGDARYDNPSCVKPLAERADGLDMMFRRQTERAATQGHIASTLPQEEPVAGPSHSEQLPMENEDFEMEGPGDQNHPVELHEGDDAVAMEQAGVDKGKAPERS